MYQTNSVTLESYNILRHYYTCHMLSQTNMGNIIRGKRKVSDKSADDTD